MNPFDYRLIPYTQTVAEVIMSQRTNRYPLPIAEEVGDIPPLRRMHWLWRLIALPRLHGRTRQRQEEPILATPVVESPSYSDF